MEKFYDRKEIEKYLNREFEELRDITIKIKLASEEVMNPTHPYPEHISETEVRKLVSEHGLSEHLRGLLRSL